MSDSKKKTAWALFAEEQREKMVDSSKVKFVKCTITPRRENYANTKTGITYGVAGKGVVAVPFDKPVMLPAGIFNRQLAKKENCSAKDNPFIFKVSVIAYYDAEQKECEFASKFEKKAATAGSIEADAAALELLKSGDLLGGLQALGLVKGDDITKAANILDGTTTGTLDVESDGDADETTSDDYYCKYVEKDDKWKVYETGSDESRSVKNFDSEEEALAFIESKNID